MILIFIIFIFFYGIYLTLIKNHDYWKKKNVPFLKPKILFGNYYEYILMRKCQAQVMSEICDKFPNEPYVGSFFGTDPALIIQDPDILKLIMQKDFNYFTGREIMDYTDKEMVTNILFFLGGDKWKVLRQNLNPIFTSAKIKNMFPLIKNCAYEFQTLLEVETEGIQEINIKSLVARYTMDCIISCVFGYNANCLKGNEEDNPFVDMGLKLFDTSIIRGLKMVCRSMWPSLFYGLGFQMFDQTITTFFSKIFTDVSNSQLNEGCSKTDFLNLILEWRKKNYVTGSCSSPTEGKRTVDIAVNDQLLVAQLVGFFGGGYETTASSLCFLLYELAKNQQAQNRVIDEVNAYLNRNKGIEYNCVSELPYVEACIDEALRLNPTFGVLSREVTHNYTLPTGLHLQRGDRIHIPVYHIHRDPKHFPDPEIYRPERFLGEKRNKIKQFTFMPFGGGARSCMGVRFVKMPMHAAILTIFKNYKIELAENMPHCLDFQPTGIVTQAATTIYLNFTKRN